ncbi:zinc ribbon domain-containing protein [Mycobacterium sp. IDR2000157661]|uniref:zinc ribbon domain-containing protein n=1 Tax=Mycobacterium sp. IDR2000157661 TaxID=2867005 RepID=UPI001EEF5D30|nr:zinc ribbon domain-containing protein [Mycobacterium sp. IDR2000157661]ULE34616.1 zinc ribbon domain-containing protein [Mycobacterium sp. IDR2000157661]
MTESEDRVPTTDCRVCRTEVPAGNFCGLCGCHLTPRRAEGPDWLRLRNYGAAMGEPLLLPSVASSLFPNLSRRSRTAFRLGLVVVVAALAAFTYLRMPAGIVTVSALGLPLLFLLYLRESDAFRDFPVGTLVLAAAVGIGLGVGWVLLTGAMVAHSYGIALGSAITGGRLLRDGIGVPLGGLILMLMPAVIVRLLRAQTREALDGFMIGALGALTFTAAATITRLAPQFGTGVVSKRPLESLVVEAGIRGVAVPLIAAAAGGLIGAALWFTRPPSKRDQRPGAVRLVLVSLAAAVIAVYLALGLIDIARFPQLLMLAMYLTLALAAMLVLRVGLHLALLHEAHDPIRADEPLLCTQCGHVVPDMAFCPACGSATRASSRSSRRQRREHRPVRTRAEGP